MKGKGRENKSIPASALSASGYEGMFSAALMGTPLSL